MRLVVGVSDVEGMWPGSVEGGVWESLAGVCLPLG